MTKTRDQLLFERLKHHLAARTDPCQDRGADWPCDVAEALGFGPESPVEPRTGGSAWDRVPETGSGGLRAPAWVASTCCQGTGYADYAAVPCPAPDCPVPEAQRRAPIHVTMTPEQAHALDPMHEWYRIDGCPVCTRQAAEQRYGHLTSDERRALAAYASRLAEQWHGNRERYDRWRAVADDLDPDTTEVRS